MWSLKGNFKYIFLNNIIYIYFDFVDCDFVFFDFVKLFLGWFKRIWVWINILKNRIKYWYYIYFFWSFVLLRGIVECDEICGLIIIEFIGKIDIFFFFI